MSWITGLADKAENLLNKIDKNAATALQIPHNADPSSPYHSVDSSLAEGLRRNLSSNSLSLSLSKSSTTPSARRYVKSEQNFRSNAESSPGKSEQTNSVPSSRRSSFSSKTDPVTIELGIDAEIEPKKGDYSVERELVAFKIALSDVTSERNELKAELASLQDEFNQSRSNVRLQELEILASDLTFERDQLHTAVEDLKLSNTAYVKSISDLELNMAKIRQEFIEVSEKLSLQLIETQQQSLALEQYRKKAQATLQTKDRIIEELKSSGKYHESPEHSNDKVLKYEIDSARQEIIHLREENTNLSSQLENFKLSLQRQQAQMDERTSNDRETENTLRSSLRSEQQRSLQMEGDVKILNQEISAVREQLNAQRQTFTVRLREKDNEIAKIRLQVVEMTNSDAGGLESRIQSLTQSLVRKQAAVESMTAEKNAMRLKLERVEDQLDHLIAQNSRDNRPLRSQIISLNDTDDAKSQFPQLMRANPFDNRVARRVKRAYSTLDSAGIRLGVFLRRYPLIRILVFIYVAILHIWVMFVLLSSTPPT